MFTFFKELLNPPFDVTVASFTFLICPHVYEGTAQDFWTSSLKKKAPIYIVIGRDNEKGNGQ